MARPKSNKPIKEKTLQSKVTLEEYTYYNEKAKELGMNVSTLIRMSLINFLKEK